MEKFNIGISLIVLLAIFDLVMSCCQSQSKHDKLKNGEEIKSENPGDYFIESPNKSFKALFTSSGLFRIQLAFTILDSERNKVWETNHGKWNTNNTCFSRKTQEFKLPYYLEMQKDCDLVLYDWCVAGHNQVVWKSKTARKSNSDCFLQLTDLGRLEIRDEKNNNQLIWESSVLNEDGRNCFIN